MVIYLQGGLALAVAAAAAVTDVRAGLIPNRLTLSALGAGLLLGVASGGLAGGGLALAGALVAALVPLLLFRVGAMGGGDVKLLAAFGALLGAGAALEVQGVAFGVGALQGLILWARRGELGRGLRATVGLLGRSHARRRADGPRGNTPGPITEIRFGPALFVGAAWVVGLRLWGGL